MKKILLVFIFIAVLSLTACVGFEIPSGNNLPTGITANPTETTTNITGIEITTEVPTEVPTTPTQTTIESITSIINDETYLQLNAGQDTVEINSEWIDSGANFVLNDTSFGMITEDKVDITALGLYKIEYTYTYEEEVYSITRYVIVVDQVAPEIELNLGVDTVLVGNKWTDAGVTITDNSREEVEAEVNGSVDINTPGTYTITYTATDSSGNSNSITRYVNIIE